MPLKAKCYVFKITPRTDLTDDLKNEIVINEPSNLVSYWYLGNRCPHLRIWVIKLVYMIWCAIRRLKWPKWETTLFQSITLQWYLNVIFKTRKELWAYCNAVWFWALYIWSLSEASKRRKGQGVQGLRSKYEVWFVPIAALRILFLLSLLLK